MEDKKMTVSLFELFYKYIVKVADSRGDKNSHFVVWLDNDTVEILGDVLKLLKEQETDWISVKGRLPELKQKEYFGEITQESDEVLVYVQNVSSTYRHIYMAYTVGSDGLWHSCDDDFCDDYIVTHWMPLPEAPEEV